jgi:hypothetical protein
VILNKIYGADITSNLHNKRYIFLKGYSHSSSLFKFRKFDKEY